MNTDIKYFELENKSKTAISHDVDDIPITECAIGQNLFFVPSLSK